MSSGTGETCETALPGSDNIHDNSKRKAACLKKEEHHENDVDRRRRTTRDVIRIKIEPREYADLRLGLLSFEDYHPEYDPVFDADFDPVFDADYNPDL